MVCRMKRKKMKFRLQPKLIMGLVFMAVVLVLALTSVVVVVYRGQMEEQYGKVKRMRITRKSQRLSCA